jgi:hypothetical protein
MDMKGDVYNNSNFFPAEWENDKIAIGQDEKDEKIRVATLLIIMGKECLQLQRHLHMQDADREDSAKIIDALQKHFEPNRNVNHERFVFNDCKQSHCETTEQYVAKVRGLADTCEFGALKDDLVRDRLVMGTKDSSAHTGAHA